MCGLAATPLLQVEAKTQAMMAFSSVAALWLGCADLPLVSL